MNVYIPYTRLPSAYQEVEYIQSSGTQYIDTETYINPNYTVEVKYQLVDLNPSYQTIFGQRNGEQQKFTVRYRKSDSSIDFQRSSTPTSNAEYSSDLTGYYNTNEHILSQSRYGYIDGVNKKSFTYNSTASSYSLQLYIFALNHQGEYATDFASMRLYYCKIYDTDGTTLVRDFIPCYRVSDNEIGLFDKVNKKFYTNAGTGTFTKGNDVKVFQPELKNAYIGEFSLPRPAITRSTQDGYTISADSAAGNPPDMYHATDNNPSTYWLSGYGTGSYSHWLKMELPTPSAATSIFLKARTNSNANEIRFPSAIKLQGSNDDSSWTDIQSWTRSSIVASGTEFNYTFNNTTSYKYYRILVTPSQWVSGYGGYAVLAEWNLS